MATVGEYKAEIKLTPLPATVSYRVEVDAYYFGSVEDSVNTLKAFNHVYDWNLAATGVIEDHTLRITDNAVELDPVEFLYWSGAANPTLTPITTPAKVTLTQYDAVNGGQGVGSILDTEVLYLPNPGSGQSHNFEATISSARFSSPITKAGAGIEIQQDGNFAKLVATATAPTASDGVRVVSSVIQLDIGGLTDVIPATPTLDSLVYWDQDLDSHKRITIDQMPLTQFSDTGFTVNAEAVNAGTFPAGTWVFPSSSTIQVGSTSGDTPNIQFWDRDNSPGGYLDVISVPSAFNLDIGSGSWAVDILGSSVTVNGSAIVTSVTGTAPISVTAGSTPDVSIAYGNGIGLTSGELDLDFNTGLSDWIPAHGSDGNDQFVMYDIAGTIGHKRIKTSELRVDLMNTSSLSVGFTNAGDGLVDVGGAGTTVQVDYVSTSNVISDATNLTGLTVDAANDRLLLDDVSAAGNAGDPRVGYILVNDLPFTNNTGDVESLANATNGGLAVTDGGGPDITIALAVDNLSDHSGTLVAADRFAVWELGAGTRKIAASSIGLNSFNNNLALDASDIAQGQFATVGGTYTFAGAAVLQMGSNTLQPTLQFWDRDTVGGGYRDVITVPAVEELDIGSAGWAVDILGSSVLVNGAAIGTVSLVQNATNGGLTVTNGSGPTVDLEINIDDLEDIDDSIESTKTPIGTDQLAFARGANNYKEQFNAINLTAFNDDLGYTTVTASLGAQRVVDDISINYGSGANGLIGAAPNTGVTPVGSDALLIGDGGLTSAVESIQFSDIPLSIMNTGNFVESNVNETIAGQWEFSSRVDINNDLRITDSAPAIEFLENDQAANEGGWRIVASGSNFFVQTRTDAFGSGVDVWRVLRGTGTAISSMDFNGINLRPYTNSTGGIGTNSFRWANAYIDDLTLTNPLSHLYGGLGLSNSPATNELIVSLGPGNGYEGSGSGLVWNGTTLTATNFSGNGSGLTFISADSSTVTNLGANTNTYYPIMADGASGSVSHFVESSDLFWTNGDKRLEVLNLRVLNDLTMASNGDILMGTNGIVNIGASGVISHNPTQTRDKIRVWNSALYTIGMKSGYTFGSLSDYAMSVQMNGTAGRGWWWGIDTHTDAQGVMSLNNVGELTVADSIRVGYGTSDTTAHGINALDISMSNGATIAIDINDTAVGDTILDWGGTGVSRFKKITDQGGISWGADSSIVISAGDTVDAYVAGEGIVAATSSESLHLAADANVIISPNQQSGYTTATRWAFNSIGQLRAYYNGASATPTYSFNNDPDTGMRLVSAGILRLSSGTDSTFLDVSSAASRIYTNRYISIEMSADEKIRVGGSSLGPFISYYVGATRYGYIQMNTGTGLGDFIYNAQQSVSYKHRFLLGSEDRFVIDGIDGDRCRYYMKEGQFYVEEEQTTLSVAATVNCDWDQGNQLHLDITSTVTTINIDDTSMQAGGSYILMVSEGTSAPTNVTWSSGTTLYWANGTQPVLNGGDLNDITVVQFFKTTAGDDRIIGSWFLAQ